MLSKHDCQKCFEVLDKIRQLIESVKELSGVRMPTERANQIGHHLLRLDTELFGAATHPDAPDEISNYLFQFITLMDDIDIGCHSGRELKQRARQDLAARN